MTSPKLSTKEAAPSGAVLPTWRCGHERIESNTLRSTDRRTSRGYIERCRECQLMAHARHRRTKKGRASRERASARYCKSESGRAARARNCWTQHGIDPSFTWADYMRLLLKQGGKCALCRQRPDEDRRLDADHDHNDPRSRVRGLLHWRCNKLVGLYESDRLKNTKLITKVRAYLNRAKEN